MISSFLSFLVKLDSNQKLLILLALEFTLSCLAVVSAFYLRLGFLPADIGEKVLLLSFLSASLQMGVGLYLGLYKTLHRQSGPMDLGELARCYAISGILFCLVVSIGVEGVPRTIGLIQPLVLFFLGSYIRFVFANQIKNISVSSQVNPNKIYRLIIYGAGSAGQAFLKQRVVENRYTVVAFLDDDVSKHGREIAGIRIYSSHQLQKLIDEKKVDYVLLAMPSITHQERQSVIKTLERFDVEVRSLPSLTDILMGRASLTAIERLDLDDLMDRELVSPDQRLMRKNLLNKRVLITGAGGSVGGEISRQALELDPEVIVLIESSEFSLYKIDEELRVLLTAKQSKCKVVPILCSVTDSIRLNRVLEVWRPHTVFHAAAYKHVPLVEHNVGAAYMNNVEGTWVVAEACASVGVDNFVLISTDKAVRPTNVMGATKRLAELVVLGMKDRPNTITSFSIVRFGNVIGSSGSVLPKFKEQIEKKRVITLTHPEVTRFFMSLSEAAQLVIQSSALAKEGGIYLLDMGQPVKVIELARRLIRLSGYSERNDKNPNGEVAIEMIGLRPGEKLFEELLIDGSPLPTEHPKIYHGLDKGVSLIDFRIACNEISSHIHNADFVAVLKLFEDLVEGYQPSSETVDFLIGQP